MSVLFSPIKVRGFIFRSRVVMPPMVTARGDTDGCVTSKIIDHYGKRADAGTGLIIVEATCVDPTGRCWERGLGAFDQRHVSGLSELAARIRGAGAVAAIQLVHGGPQASPEVAGSPTVGPSTVPCDDTAPAPRALLIDEILAIEKRFADAAARCVDAGFDAVEIHGAHGFLLDSFLSAERNRRTDAYGGSLQGRMRMLKETCERVKSTIGGALLICRVSIFNKVPEGFTADDFRELVRTLESAGVDILHISTVGAFASYFGSRSSIGQLAKDLSDCPVIVAGGLGDPADAERAVSEGHCDFAGVGSAMLENPAWTERARSILT